MHSYLLSLAVALALASCTARQHRAFDATNAFPRGTLTAAEETNAVYTMTVDLEFGHDFELVRMQYHFCPLRTKRLDNEAVPAYGHSLPICRSSTFASHGPSFGWGTSPEPSNYFPTDAVGLKVRYTPKHGAETELFVPLKLGHSSTGTVDGVRYRATWTTASGAPPFRRPKR